MNRQIIQTEMAPAAIGPYSQGVRANGIIYFSGQIPIDPLTGEVLQAGIAEQTKLVMKNIEALLKAAGGNFADVVKTTIYLTNLADFATVNEIYGKCFPGTPPARSTVQVAALPRAVDVEIEVIALDRNP